MTIQPITASTKSALATNSVTSSWAGRLISYPFSSPIVKKVMIVVVLILITGIVLTALDHMTSKDLDDYNPHSKPKPPKGQSKPPRSRKPAEKPEPDKKSKALPRLPDDLPKGDLNAICSNPELLRTPPPRGIPNGGNGCFLNSMLQVIMHSGLYKHFLNPKNMILKDTSECYRLFAWFTDKYQSAEGLSNHYFRQFLNYEPGTQECPGEAFDRWMFNFDMTAYENTFQKHIKVTGDKTEVTVTEDITKEKHEKMLKEASTLIDDGFYAIEDKHRVLKFPAPEKDGQNLSDIFSNFCNSEQEDSKNPIKFVKDGKLYQASKFKQELTITDEGLKNDLFIAINRALPNGKKNKKALGNVRECQFGHETFDLKGFAYHHGNGSTGGHYVAYCFIPNEDKWYYFNDSSAFCIDTIEEARQLAERLPQIESEKDKTNKQTLINELIQNPEDVAYEFAKTASLLYFTKSDSDNSLPGSPGPADSDDTSDLSGNESGSGSDIPLPEPSDEELLE